MNTIFNNFKEVLYEHITSTNPKCRVFVSSDVHISGNILSLNVSNLLNQLYFYRIDDIIIYHRTEMNSTEKGKINLNEIDMFQNSDEYKFHISTTKPQYFINVVQCIIQAHEIIGSNITSFSTDDTPLYTIQEYYRKHK